MELRVRSIDGELGCHLIGRIVCLQLAVGGILNEDWLVPDGGRGRGVVVHHSNGSFLRRHF